MARCGNCTASPSVRLKPTAVRVMANPTASEIKQVRGAKPGTARTVERGSRKLLSTLAKGRQNLPIITIGEKGQKIRFKLLFRLMNERAKKKGAKKTFQETIPRWWKE